MALNIELLKTIRDAINNELMEFNMDEYAAYYSDTHQGWKCDTPACIAGFAVVLAEGGKTPNAFTVSAAAQRLLNLDSDWLFHVNDWPFWAWNMVDSVHGRNPGTDHHERGPEVRRAALALLDILIAGGDPFDEETVDNYFEGTSLGWV